MQIDKYKVEDKLEALQPLLDSVEYDDEEEIKKITKVSSEIISNIIFSMRKERDFNFFAVLLDKINILIDYHLEAAMACGFKRNHFELYVNPFIAFRFDKYMIRAFIIHECYHIIMNHIQRSYKYIRSGDYAHSIINIGLDTSINQYIDLLKDDDRFCTLNKFRQLVNDNTIEGERECEYYIGKLKNSPYNNSPNKMQEEIKEFLNNQKQQNDDSSQDDDNKEKGKDKKEKEKQNDGSGSDGSNSDDNREDRRVAKQYGEGIHDWKKTLENIKKGDPNIQKQMLDELLKQTSSKSIGKIPQGIEQILEEIKKEPIVRWQDVLKQYIGRIPIPFKRTSTRLSRRMPERLDILGKLPDAYYKIVVAVDTSGSMSDRDIQLCFNEIWNIISLQKKKFDITIIECDCEINKIYNIKRKSDFKKVNISGRGGTSFSPVFEYLRNNRIKYKDCVTIYFTDGYGENELSVKPLNNNNIWVLTGKVEDLSLNKCYGKKLELHLEELYKKYNR